jgi:hypothetical protein
LVRQRLSAFGFAFAAASTAPAISTFRRALRIRAGAPRAAAVNVRSARRVETFEQIQRARHHRDHLVEIRAEAFALCGIVERLTRSLSGAASVVVRHRGEHVRALSR